MYFVMLLSSVSPHNWAKTGLSRALNKYPVRDLPYLWHKKVIQIAFFL